MADLTASQKVAQAFDAILVRCEEGDPKVDWLPTISRLALEGKKELAALEAELAAAREALAPFARVGKELEGSEYEGNYLIVWRSEQPSSTLEHSDFVRARSALPEDSSGG